MIDGDDESEGFTDLGQVQDFTACGKELFCKRFCKSLSTYLRFKCPFGFKLLILKY